MRLLCANLSRVVVGIGIVTIGSIAAAAPVYDTFVDFGTSGGRTSSIAGWFTNTSANASVSFTPDSVVFTRTDNGAMSTEFLPTVPYSSGPSTVDIAIRRIALDDLNPGHRDVAVQYHTAALRRYEMVLFGDDSESPAFSSNPDSDGEIHVYRIVPNGGSATMYVDDDPVGVSTPTIHNPQGSKVTFSVETNRTAALGFEIAWIGISSTESANEAPGSYTVPEPTSIGLCFACSAFAMLVRPKRRFRV